MERLTREMTFEEEYIILQKEVKELFDKEDRESEPPESHCVVRRALRCIKKLVSEVEQYKAYNGLEEQGRLIKLPCKVGDTVYVNGVLGCGEAERYRVIRVDYHSTLGTGRNEFYIEALLCTDPDSSIAFYDKQFGKTVFLTKPEAEQKLKEMESD